MKGWSSLETARPSQHPVSEYLLPPLRVYLIQPMQPSIISVKKQDNGLDFDPPATVMRRPHTKSGVHMPTLTCEHRCLLAGRRDDGSTCRRFCPLVQLHALGSSNPLSLSFCRGSLSVSRSLCARVCLSLFLSLSLSLSRGAEI